MTDTRDRLGTLAVAVLEADRGHREMHGLLVELIPILKEQEPLLAIGVEILCASLSERCQALLNVTIDVCKAESI